MSWLFDYFINARSRPCHVCTTRHTPAKCCTNIYARAMPDAHHSRTICFTCYVLVYTAYIVIDHPS